MRTFSLKDQKEFDYVSKHGLKVHGLYFILIISPCLPLSALPTIPSLAFGMKVSRRFSKKAVVRNKVKRRIRHIVTMLAKDLEINLVGKSIIIIPKKGFDKTNFAKLFADFKRSIVKANLKPHQVSY